MFYYQCKRCNYIAKQKIDMKRHLEKQKKCIINNNEEKDDFQLREESLVKHFMDDELKSIIKKTKLNIKITPQDVLSGNKKIVQIKLLLQDINKFFKK